MRNWGSSAMMWILINTTRPRGVEGTGGPGCGARGRQRGLAGLRGDAQSHTSAHQAPQVWRAPEGPAAAPEGLRGLAGQRADAQSHTSAHHAPQVLRAPEGPGARASLQTRGLAAVPVGGGGARAGLEIDHSEPQARVWRSRGRAAAHRHTQRPGPSRQATRRPEHQRGHKQQAAHTKTPTRNRVGVSEPPVGIEPTTYSLRVNRSAD